METVDLAKLFAQEGKDLAAVVAESLQLTADADAALSNRDTVAANGSAALEQLSAEQNTAFTAKQGEVDAANAVAEQSLAAAVQKRDAKAAQVKAEVDYIVKLAQTLGQDASDDPTPPEVPGPKLPVV